MPKKFRSKWTRVAVEGATTDGRQIEATWIKQMAANYNPEVYGARIWMEHLRSTWHDGAFKAYGDVLAVKAEEVEINGEKRLALFAQIEPTDALIDIVNVQKQKVFTSIEVNPKFADTGEAYLVGLAVTDTPASLGTEMLSFAAQHPESNPLKARKQDADNLFTAAEPSELEFEEVLEQSGMFKELLAKVTTLLSKSKETEGKDATNFAQLGEALEGLIAFTTEQQEALAANGQQLTALEQQITELTTEFNQLKDQLGNTEDHSQQRRPPVSGGNGQILADY